VVFCGGLAAVCGGSCKPLKSLMRRFRGGCGVGVPHTPYSAVPPLMGERDALLQIDRTAFPPPVHQFATPDHAASWVFVFSPRRNLTVNIEDFDKYIDEDLLNQAQAKLDAVIARRPLAQARLATAEAAHATATRLHAAALSGASATDPHQSQPVLREASMRLDTAREAVPAVEAAIKGAERDFQAALGRAHQPRYDAAARAAVEACHTADEGRALLATAEGNFRTAVAVIRSAVAHRASPGQNGTEPDKSSPSLTRMDGKFVIPTEAEMRTRLGIQSK
jgi:hypothetical protein